MSDNERDSGMTTERDSDIIDQSFNPKNISHVTKNKGKWNKNHIIKTFLEGNKMSRILLFLFMYYCIFKIINYIFVFFDVNIELGYSYFIWFSILFFWFVVLPLKRTYLYLKGDNYSYQEKTSNNINKTNTVETRNGVNTSNGLNNSNSVKMNHNENNNNENNNNENNNENNN
mgnify:CR=1 FL=1|tara:strand:+ start:2348 stop:2866 length:519 start_codon:yes stop_codon:yes gene_type:complete